MEQLALSVEQAAPSVTLSSSSNYPYLTQSVSCMVAYVYFPRFIRWCCAEKN